MASSGRKAHCCCGFWRVPQGWAAHAFGMDATPAPAVQAFWDGLARRAVDAWAPFVAVFRQWLDRAAADPEGTRDALDAVLQACFFFTEISPVGSR
ncbi:MAG: hypothetical protein K6U87_05815 [Firmicutes bacterium]|nr:hypothetical protein [Bacillota bacterium]